MPRQRPLRVVPGVVLRRRGRLRSVVLELPRRRELLLCGGGLLLGRLDVSSDIRCYSTSPRTARRTTYAAEGKHALYHTDSECDGGGVLGADECPRNAYNMRTYVPGHLQNVGNSNVHSVDTQIQHPDGCHLYDVWSGDPFAESTNYESHFLYPLRWDLP